MLNNVTFRRSVPVYPIFAFILAIIYGGILAGLPLEVFSDRANYLVHAENAQDILARYWETGPLVMLANEPVWLLINTALATWLPPENVLRLLIFVPASLVAWLVLRHDSRQFVWLLLILLFPVVNKNFIVHLRQGVAIAVFLAGWMAPRRPIRWALFAAAPFIHASFFIVLALMAVAHATRFLRLAADIRTLLFVAMGIAAGSGIGFLAAQLGARQALQYEFSMTDVSGLGFLFWALVFLVWCFQGRDFLRRHAFEAGVIVFYLGTYFSIEVTARIFESALPVVLLAGLALTGWRRLVFLILLLSYGGLQWILRVGQPGLGFGIG